MAIIVRQAENTMDSLKKKQHFYRTMDLNMSIGSETMRDLVKQCLKDTRENYTLSQHISRPNVWEELNSYSHLCTEQTHNLRSCSPSLEKMDTTVLTILLQTFSVLPANLKSSVRQLRSIRNKLAHAVRGELDDNSLFNESAKLILALAKVIGPGKQYAQDLNKKINELENRQLVNTVGNLDRVKINNEMFVVKLVESDKKEKIDSGLVIKVCLTKWCRQLARRLNVEDFLSQLKKEMVINDTLRRQILDEYTVDEQMQMLILHMVNETDFNLKKLCKVLRSLSPVLADLIENSNTDGKEVEKDIEKWERENIGRVLRENVKMAENSSLATSDLHICLEEALTVSLVFDRVKRCVLEIFPDVQFSDGDSSFGGLSWKEGKKGKGMEGESDTAEEKPVRNMTCKEFADYVALRMSRLKETLDTKFRKAILEESISPNAFVEMTKEEMKDTFSTYLKYGIGLEKELMIIQRKIKSECCVEGFIGHTGLRPFDCPTGNVHYRGARVCCQSGNLLIPKHEFRYSSRPEKYTRYFIAKEVVKFAAACINGRKNGTIHFGIKHIYNETGEVIGIPNENGCWKNLNEEICRSVETCFGENAAVALKCVRPFQRINIENGRFVIEIDVVPSSKYINRVPLSISFPPKGSQKTQLYIYDLRTDCELLSIVLTKVPSIEKTCADIFDLRKKLEEELEITGDHRLQVRKQLVKALTAGNKYVTDQFIPLIVTGKITDNIKESNIRGELEMDTAFASAKLVLDFDSSEQLRNQVEKGDTIFRVKTAEDFKINCELTHKQQTWVYCNGNEELSEKEMGIAKWIECRSDGVRCALEDMKRLIPYERAKVIFLIYQPSLDKGDPLLEIVEMAFVSLFRNQCIVIAEKDSVVENLRAELRTRLGEKCLEKAFFTGLNWSEVSSIMKSVFRASPDVVCKLPHCDGYYVEMTKKERDELKFTDIDILSGEQCAQENEEKKLSEEDRRKHRNEAQEKFYKGGIVTWWNFYYHNHVGKRDLFERHKEEVKDKLTSKTGEALIEIHELEHHPGAGGSTLGRHLIWHFSQFKNSPEKAYRCCLVKNVTVTEETINQIESFNKFKEGECPKPFIVFVDNMSEDNIILLKTRLHKMACETGCPGKLFCLLLVVKRKPISHIKMDGIPVLTHKLSQSENDWFESKYNEMENSKDINVKTLITFNLMRKSFDMKYLRTTVQGLMADIPPKEKDVLKCLALISSYESDHPVPENVFDAMMNEQIDYEMIKGQPWGIAHSVPELNRLARARNETWNIHMTVAMDLLLTKREDSDFYNSGVCLISQMVAREVISYIQRTDNLSLEQIVDYLLTLVEKQMKETNPMSKRFVKIVRSLFKTRHLYESDRGDMKLKFSDLILELEHPVEDESDALAQQRVLRVMKRCFLVTGDAMVGQQLARFYIYIKLFDDAEDAIKRSLEKRQNSSYLLDTYGQIFKAKMEFLLEECLSGSRNNVDDDKAADIVRLALKAIEKFTEGQKASISQEEDINSGCFQTEIKTGIALLENFEIFSCYQDRNTFLHFLNDDEFEINVSPYRSLMQKCPELEQIRNGSDLQSHLETSLRFLEERNYQVTRQLYTVFSEDETLLLRLRERFERFYGSYQSTSKYQFTYGNGLKPLTMAKERNKKQYETRVREARDNLIKANLDDRDERDLLVYIGDRIIALSSQDTTSKNEQCSVQEYKRLLSYCDSLVRLQISETLHSKRPYLEAFLYYAMLHYPLKSRTDLDLEPLAKPKSYELIVQQWEETYNRNYFIKNKKKDQTTKPNNYFALVKGTPGNDIVDVEPIWIEWMNKKKSTSRTRRPVLTDNFWKENFEQEQLVRLDGIVDGSGNFVTHQAEYPDGTHTFKISIDWPRTQLSNRKVTFVLGFTWKGPTAFDVQEKGKSQKLHLPAEQERLSPSNFEDILGADANMGRNEREQSAEQAVDSKQLSITKETFNLKNTEQGDHRELYGAEKKSRRQKKNARKRQAECDTV